MEDILFSRQQFNALISRLDDIRNNVSVFKQKANPGTGCMEAHDIIRQFNISKRTLERWRQTGRVPFHKVGNFFYFNTDDIVGQIGRKSMPSVKDPDESPCLSDKELRDRHRVALINRRWDGVQLKTGCLQNSPIAFRISISRH